jgi:hypothetical protein
MKTNTHDPRLDPQPGDVLVKNTSANNNEGRRERHVIRRIENNVYYRDHLGKERMCWLDSWLHWAQGASLPDENQTPLLKTKEQYLEAIHNAPGKLLAEMGKVWPNLGEAVKTGLITESDMLTAFRRGMRQMISDVEEGRHAVMTRLSAEMARMEAAAQQRCKNN